MKKNRFAKTAVVILCSWPGLSFLSPHTSGNRVPGIQHGPRVHYLGHASFLLTFREGLTVLTDYGESNAYGLNSPVHSLGKVRPSIVTLSHDHPDHAGGKLPDGDHILLSGHRRYEAEGLVITPLPSFENNLENPDNVAFLFDYGGWKILHLGDCQALMVALGASENPGEMRDRIRALFPDRYDLVLLPIGFTRPILSEASEFASLLNARSIVPMHYWDPADRDAFLDLMEGRRTVHGEEMIVRRRMRSTFYLPSTPWNEGSDKGSAEVVGLQPGPVVPLSAGSSQEDGVPPAARQAARKAASHASRQARQAGAIIPF